MNTTDHKIELAKLILELESPELIKKIHAFLFKEVFPEREPLSQQQKKEISIGLEQLDKGDRILFEDFLKKVS